MNFRLFIRLFVGSFVRSYELVSALQPFCKMLSMCNSIYNLDWIPLAIQSLEKLEPLCKQTAKTTHNTLQTHIHNNRINIKYETTILIEQSFNGFFSSSYFGCLSFVCRAFSTTLSLSFHISSFPFRNHRHCLCCMLLLLRFSVFFSSFFLHFPFERWNCLLNGQPRCEHCEL